MESQFGGNPGEFDQGSSLPPGLTPPAPPPPPPAAEPEAGTVPGPVPPPVYSVPTAPGLGGPPAGDYLSTSQIAKKGPGRAWIALAVAFCVALVAGILAFVVSGGSTTSSMQPAALVQAAAQKTLGEKTADIQMSGSVNADGLTIPISGSGQVEFAHQAVSLTMDMSIEGQSISINEIFVGGNDYERVNSASFGGTQKWIEIPIPDTGNGVGLGDGSENLAGQLKLLAEQGAIVKKIGTGTIDGVQTTEYSVVPSKQQVLAGIKKALSSPGLSPALKQELKSYEQSPPTLSQDVWIDGSGLLRREAVNVSIALTGSSQGSGKIVMTLSNYGTHVNISAPPPGDTESLNSVTNTAADRAAQSNLVNAITEGKALYEVNQEYGSPDGGAYEASDFTQQAPEFSWNTGSCQASEANCISFAVLDVGVSGDYQGLAVSTYSTTGTCWYAVDVEATPAPISGDPSAIWSLPGGGENAALTAGVWYATSPSGVTETSCSASSVLHASAHVGWAQSFTSAGPLG